MSTTATPSPQAFIFTTASGTTIPDPSPNSMTRARTRLEGTDDASVVVYGPFSDPNEYFAQASEGVLAEAKALRERLHKKHKKESQKLRRAQAAETEARAGISGLALDDAPPQLPHADADADAAPAAAAPPPAAAAPPPAAAALPPAAPVVVTSLADAQLDTGRREAPESTIGGQTTCIICFSNPKSHAAVPCGHMCACGDCSAQLDECPVCRSPAAMWMHVRVA